jgi:Zn-dependent M28 family amino/carboxypeptidase
VRRAVLFVPLAAGLLAAILSFAPEAPRLSSETRTAAEELRRAALSGSRASDWVQSLTDRAGARLAGSEGDRAAVAWALETLRAQGFANVRAEKVTVPVWKRGVETGELTAPHRHTLALTALGGSVPTPPGGIEAEVLEVDSLEMLEAKGAAASGKIVFFNKKMARSRDGSGYGKAVPVRSEGAIRAAKQGAVAVVIRSIGTDNNRLPHTGAMRENPTPDKIPAAALSNPDADLLARLVREGGPVRLRLTLGCRTLPDAESANVLGEVPGGALPEEIVLLGAHLDSWDLGLGALDDGAGCGIVLEAARLIGRLPRRPRRTIRVVFFANEENGLAGGKAYAATHAGELGRHAAAIEADSGTGRPFGFQWNAGTSAGPWLAEVGTLLEPFGANEMKAGGHGGADISRLVTAGVPLFGLFQDATTYFDIHHSANDTLDKIDPESLDRAVAATAVLAYCLADSPEPIERIPAAKRRLPRW